MASVVPNNEATQFKTGDKQVEIAKKGGIASGIARQRKSICNKLLNNMITSAEAKEELRVKGLLDDDMTELAFSMYDLLSTSRDKKNEKTSDRLKALEMLMSYADDGIQQSNETPNVSITIVDNSNLEKAMYSNEEN